MNRWRKFWNDLARRQTQRPKNRPQLLLENLESRELLSAAPFLPTSAPAGLTVAPGYTAKIFSAAPPTGASAPDSITVDGQNVYVGYGNGGDPAGLHGAMSTIVQYTEDGKVVQTWTVVGHNDGLKVDPNTHRVWALQNEDANPNLVIIDPKTGSMTTPYALPPVNGGGYDDIVFLDGKVYLSASNPANYPNNAPAIVQVRLKGSTVKVTPVLFGDATATNTVTGQTVTLNLQDPDSMTANANGDLVMTSQADDELVTIHDPGRDQSVSVTPLSDASKTAVSVDDTLFPPDATGEVLVTDQKTGAIYMITVPAGSSPQALSAAPDIGQVGTVNTTTGLFTPVVSGLGSPKGLAFLNTGGKDIGKDAAAIQKEANADAKTVKSAEAAADAIGQFKTTGKVEAQLDLIEKSTKDAAGDLLAIGAGLEELADDAGGLHKASPLLQAADEAVADAQKTIDRIKDTTAKIDALLKGVQGTIPAKIKDKIDQYASQIAQDEASLETDDDVIAANAEKILDLVGHGK